MSSGHYSEDVSNRVERYASNKHGAFEASLTAISALLQPAGATRESFGRHFLTAAFRRPQQYSSRDSSLDNARPLERCPFLRKFCPK